jgi:ABC-type lipoprotein export system ATPase subunit
MFEKNMKISIRNVKGIASLDFEIPSGGVWIMTGLNGSGKSTVLATLYRIKYSYAFQQFFRTSPLADEVDLFENAAITYEINGQSVTYRYGGQRWRAKPRSNSSVLNDFPYSSVLYLEANSERIEPLADEITGNRLRDANDDIKNFLVEVLADDKWKSLKFINTRRGRGNEAFLIPYRSGRGYQYKYYSEKSFSLGELCILRLAKRLTSIQNDGLVLIDEIEMALHPQAQVRLLEKLRTVSQKKNATIIFSTHSASIVKTAGRQNLIHLVNTGDNTIEVIRNPYPAQILGEIAFDDELGADFIFFVEDKEGKILLEQMIQEYFVITNSNINYRPLCKIAPVGGFIQVLEFVNASSQIFPSYVRRIAFLDKDVEEESLKSAKKRNDYKILELFEKSKKILNYLPCTPEAGVIDMIEKKCMDKEIKNRFTCHTVNIDRIISSKEYCNLNGNNIRKLAKEKFLFFTKKVSQSTAIDELQVRRILYNVYTKYKYGNVNGDLNALLGPIFNFK